jgi:hypothetical protein
MQRHSGRYMRTQDGVAVKNKLNVATLEHCSVA